ncbi:D-glucuronyl C5-epimerase family protein [Pseudomonas sp. NY11955]|uniref:D-glucuronyl C5-epimerase family protein n=1 Tax=Pseudomonas sp. NY11955 TaxID=3400363 RepID=UPI003A8646CE
MKIDYDTLTTEWFDRAMSTGPINPTWKPKHYLDLFREWPEKYIKNYNQPFNPFAFAINSSALASSSKKHEDLKAIMAQASFLDLAASLYTEEIEGHAYIRNDFSFSIYWATMEKPFYGAFMNAYTAYGYLKLYEATNNAKYLSKAEKLVKTITSKDCKIKLSSTDSNDDFWLNEYVFIPTPSEVDYLQKLGTELHDDGYMRFRIYNGNISAILGLMKFRKTSGLSFADETIEKSCLTMSKLLHKQAFNGKYFSYSIEAEIMPDYGQLRAVNLAKFLAEATNDDSLKNTFKSFEKLFNDSIKDSIQDIYAKGSADAALTYRPLKTPV